MVEIDAVTDELHFVSCGFQGISSEGSWFIRALCVLEGMDEEVTVVPGEDKARGYCSAPCHEKTAVPLNYAAHCLTWEGNNSHLGKAKFSLSHWGWRSTLYGNKVV